jgi:hypothetical protein
MIAATFHSTHYSPPNYDFDTIEVFPSLEEVIEVLFDRYSSNGKRIIESTYLDGHAENVAWPTVEAGAYFTCYLLTAEESSAGITEDQRMEAHTAVHGGWKDYTVTLVESEQGSLVCQVERAGI